MYLVIGLQVVEAHPLFPYFLEKSYHLYISFFHLLVKILFLLLVSVLFSRIFGRGKF